MFEQILLQIANADENKLYGILKFFPRKKRREFLRKLDEVLNGKSDLLKGQPEDVCKNIKAKFAMILKHYGR